MNPLLHTVAGAARQFQRNLITSEEFANKLSDLLAQTPDPCAEQAAELIPLLQPVVRPLVVQRIDAALAPGYMRQAFALGGRSRTPQEERAAALRETERERAWALVLKPLLGDSLGNA